MMSDFPINGVHYDYAANSIRCRADMIGAGIYFMENTSWRRSIRVLAFSYSEARQTANLILPPPPDRSVTAPNSSFSRRVEKAAGDTIPQAHKRRLTEILAHSAQEAARKVSPSPGMTYWDYRKHIENALIKVIPAQCKMLIQAAAVSDARAASHQEGQRILAEAKANAQGIRKSERLKLAKELKSARKKLRLLNQRVLGLELLVDAQSHCRQHDFSPVPGPIVEATRTAEGVPSSAGIYFVWNGNRVVYVGQSVRLAGRCLIGSHQSIFHGDWLSWVEVPKEALYFAEYFYIGILKPERNGGRQRDRVANSAPTRSSPIGDGLPIAPHARQTR